MPIDTLEDFTMESHSFRNFSPKDIEVIAHNQSKYHAREALHYIEGERFVPLLEAGHKFFTQLDTDERERFARENPGLIRWIGVYGMAEDLNPYTEYSGIETFY